MKRLILILCVIMSAMSHTHAAVDDTFTDGIFIYKVTNETEKTCKVINGQMVRGEVILRKEVNGYTVVAIGQEAFSNNTDITSITIPETVDLIDYGTFYGCSSLQSVKIPDSVTHIGTSAFEGCSSLQSVKVPDSVTEIDDRAFMGCSSLKSVKIPDSVTKIEASAFKGCSSLQSIEIPNSLSSIGASAFEGCSSLQSVKIPDSVQWIETSAFQGCSSLQSIELPNKLRSIDTSTFQGCSSLQSIVIPSYVTYLGASAFSDCTGLKSIEFSNSLTSIGSYTFNNCVGLTSVIIPSGVKEIGENPFEGCTGLIKAAYPDNISNPFSNISAIAYPSNTSIENGFIVDESTIYFAPATLSGEYTVPNNIKTIGDYAFAYCKDLTYVRMPATLSSIGKNAFEGCNLYDFTIPNSLKVFDMETLAGNPLKSLTVGSGVTQINGSASFSNSKLEKIFWLGNIPPIGYEGFNPVVNFVSNDQYHFSNQILYPFLSSLFEVDGIVYVPVSPSERTCNVVDYLYVPANAEFAVPPTITNKGIELKVIDVGAYAFYHHDYLTDMTLDNNGVIDDYAFYDCLKLNTVTFGKNIPAIKNHSFQNCEVLERVENSPALTTIGNWAFSGCVGMEYFSVGNKIKSFGDEAFSDCTGLTEFYSAAPTPPECGAQALDDIIKWNCTLYVPEGSESLYASAPQWKDFFYIKGFDGVDSVMADETAEVEIYDINGIKQTKRIKDLKAGIYIIRQGAKVEKISVR